MSPRIDAAEVRQAAQGRWGSILSSLAPCLSEAVSKCGKKHVTCPFHGGKSDFRTDKDPDLKGGAICTCGRWSDGFSLLMHANRWTFREALEEVARYLNILPSEGPRRAPAPPPLPPRKKFANDGARARERIEKTLKSTEKPKTDEGEL